MRRYINPPHILLTCATVLSCFLNPADVWGLDARNFDQVQKSLGFSAYYKQIKSKKNQKRVKIAIFDNGFSGYEKSLGTALPEDTHYIGEVAPPVAVAAAAAAVSELVPETAHGRFMAEIVYAMMTEGGLQADLAPELYLFKVTGFTNLKTAIDESIRLGVDVILHSMVREYGSNFDGGGFFNAEVNRALAGGITWVNAAGNFGKTTFNLPEITTNTDGWVELPGENQSLPIRCLKPLSGAETCSLRLVLSWNDFSDDVEVGTNKDLDLVITDDALNILQTSSLTQTNEEKQGPGLSKYPREIIEMSIQPGRYFVRVKNRSLNFQAEDQLRISADGEFIQFEKFDAKENLLNPADNPGVITVGASDSDRSSTSLRLGKPDLLAPSLVDISEKEAYLGSSNSAAIVAAGVGLVKMIAPELQREEILKLLTVTVRGTPGGPGLPSSVLGFGPTAQISDDDARPCYEVANPYSSYPSYIESVLAQGGVFVETTRGLRIATPFDPMTLMRGRRRVRADDMVMATPQGLQLRPRSELGMTPENWAEVFQIPRQATTCSLPESWEKYIQSNRPGKNFRLPDPRSI